MIYEGVHNNKEVMLLQCISGSKAYGLHTPKSDTDIKGVFCLPMRNYYGLDATAQVNNPTNDVVYYEFKRFMELLLRNNPNILELLSTPDDCILFKNEVMDLISPEMFLSRLCYQSFAGYAQTQIKKAQGLNKKIFNPVAKERKSLLDFCYVLEGCNTIALAKWLSSHDFRQESCGLVNIPHARDLFALFHQTQVPGIRLSGICSETGNEVRLSSIPDRIAPLALLSFNKDGYSAYCRDYREYWDWVERRNDERFQNTLAHGKNYDAKNMMHTFRLLNMAEEIATEHRINVRRKDREFLLRIKSGAFLYEDLIDIANEKTDRIRVLYETSDLPDLPDQRTAEDLLVFVRQSIYKRVAL